MEVQLDANISPSGGWRRVGKDWRLIDGDGAVEVVKLREGRSRVSIKVLSTSPALDLPYLPLDTSEGIRVQLYESLTERCWEADFPSSSVTVNRRGSVTSRRMVSGSLRASLRGQ